MRRLQLLGLPKSAKARVMAALWSQGMYGAEVNGISRALMGKLPSAGRAALGKGACKRRAAEVELLLAGSAAKDPQVVADVGLIRTWDRWIQRGGVWPASPAMWTNALSRRGGPLSALAEFAQRVGWHPGQAGWATTRGFVPWCQASATAAQDCQAWTLGQVAARRHDFAGLEAGLDPVDLTHWRKLSNSATHAGRAACAWCQVEAGTLHHLLFECPAWDRARREADFSFNASFPKCLSYHGLVPAPRLAFPVWPEVQAVDLPGDTLWVDGS
eukprot:674935-Amphidinium_carterae.1